MLDSKFSACQETKLPHADVHGLRALRALHGFPEGASFQDQSFERFFGK